MPPPALSTSSTSSAPDPSQRQTRLEIPSYKNTGHAIYTIARILVSILQFFWIKHFIGLYIFLCFKNNSKRGRMACIQALDLDFCLYCLDDIGSGSHVHLSLWENGVNVFMGSEVSNSQYGMSKVGECFMAGVLNHLPSILAFTAPLPNSYDRIQPNTWSGAYQCWGKENREAPLRTACPPGVPSGLVSNFEVKTFDGCANPHLGLASIIAAGIDGLRRNLSLPKPIEINPSYLGSEVPRLPNELRESVEALEKDQIFRDLIGEKLVTSVLAIRKAEIDYYGKNKDAYKQLIHKY